MKDKQEYELDNYPTVITPWFILDLLKPIIKEEFIAVCRCDRTGIKIKFANGQTFYLTVSEIK